MTSSGFLFFFSVLFVSVCSAQEFRICAFNLQNFTSSKAEDPLVLYNLKRVLSRCDVSVLQHIVDPDGKAIKTLVNAISSYEDQPFQYVSSKPLGNSPSDMQQYVFVYRSSTVWVLDQFQYSKKESFVREPFVVQFKSNMTKISEFVLIALHTEAQRAVQEMNWLYDVFLEVVNKWNNKNVMFLGDFHADCGYMTPEDKKRIRLFTNVTFHWLIDDQMDTTVTGITDCAYDRIVVHGRNFLEGIVEGSARVFDYAREYKLATQSVADSVGDHFPVEVLLKSSAPFVQATPFLGLFVILRLLLIGPL